MMVMVMMLMMMKRIRGNTSGLWKSFSLRFQWTYMQYTVDTCIFFKYLCLHQGCTNRCSLAAGLRGNEERMRKWRGNGERMRKLRGNGEKLTLYIPQFSLHFLPLSPFPLSLSISYIKIGHIMLQNVKYGTFVANVSQILTYELWGNNSGSNLLRGSSASCAGLPQTTAYTQNEEFDCGHILSENPFKFSFGNSARRKHFQQRQRQSQQH